MKTRIVQTKFWDDPIVLELDAKEKLLFIFFLTCTKNNLSGIFEMTDYEILFLTGLKKIELTAAKQKLEETKRVAFYGNWISVLNSKKYNNYESYEKHKDAYTKEVSSIPKEVLEHINNLLTSPRPVETSPGLDINTEEEIRNQNSGIRSQKSEKGELLEKSYSRIEDIGEDDITAISEHYNVPEAFVQHTLDTMKNWRDENPQNPSVKKKKNWLATLKNWVKKDALTIQNGTSKQSAGKYAVTKINAN